MKKRWLWKRLAAGFLACFMLLFSLPASAEAETASGTVCGEEETVSVGSSAALGRMQNFNEGWKFYLGTSGTAQNVNFDDSSWKQVTLPHDFSITQSYTTSGEAESGFLPGGTGWYRKSFVLPANVEGSRIILNFDGVYSDAYVFVNGTQVGEHHYGYTAFSFDITDYITCDGATENVIAVKAVNNIPSSRWYSGSGIYRDVTLDIVDPIHVDLNGTAITTPNIQNGSGTVEITAKIKNDGDASANVTVRNTVYTSDGVAASDPVETTVNADAGATVSASASAVVNSPKLWSTESPNLYYVRTELIADGEVTDTYDSDFGFRWFSFSDTGFSLNGKNVKLNGVCLHHDQGALGSAAYYDAMYRQLSIMKDMGVNAIRTSHNPADKQFIEICDELGLMVIEEFFDGWSVSKNGNAHDFGKYFNSTLGSTNQVLGGNSSMTWAEFALKSTVKRDRNNPSVILWSLGNEIQEGASADSSYPTIAQNLIDWTKAEDSTRQTTIGSNYRDTRGTIGSVHTVIKNNGGILGFNYATSSQLSSMYSAYGPIIASETSSAVNSRGIYSSQANASNVDGKYHLTSYDTSKVGWGKTAHDSMWDTMTVDYVAGEFVWTGFDYLGEPTPWNGTSTGSVSGSGAIPNSSYFGIVETTGFPKDTYYFYRSQWNRNDTTLHLVTAWDSDNMLTSSGKTPVVIYSNAPVVKLYLNDTQIGTATRNDNQTSAGHIYYTYTTSSSNSSVCTAVSGSGSTSLYATFNVAYTSGTIYAEAYDKNGNRISDVTGNSSVSTPGIVSRLNVNANRTDVDADGTGLTYISVDVTDSSGNIDTTATNTIQFSLTGNGEIVGVDNGDQATTAKYQQSSVLTGTTSASIDAYAGKALVIVRSTKDAGSFTVNASSSGLIGGSATVTAKEVAEETAEGLIAYTLVRDYTVKAGTVPELRTTARGTMADGTEVSGVIAWENITEDTYGTPGDYTINGTLTFEGLEPIAVTCRLHVIENIVAMRNISTATTSGSVPTLADHVRGVRADGTLSGEFAVVWDPMSATQFATVGDVVTVNGTATVMGDETLPVTASIRVAEAVNTESTNVAPAASGLTQDIDSSKQSDNLNSINNEVTKPGDNTSERWSNWNNRTTSDTASVTFSWDTAQLLSSVNIYYYYDGCAAKPKSVSFSYSLDGQTFIDVGSTEELVENYSLGAEYSYTFEKVINPVALRITVQHQNGTSGSNCVAITEVEIMTYAGRLEYNSSAALGSISVDGTQIAGFADDQLEYAAVGESVEAVAAGNAGITILPAVNGVVRILTISEDGSDVRTYQVTLEDPECTHENTELQNAKNATCTEKGYTGDEVCTDCGETVKAGEEIAAKGHSTAIQNKKDATCTEDGYTGDDVCTVCGTTVKAGQAIAATGHTTEIRNAKDATCTEDGYTGDDVCTVCGTTVKAGEAIPATGHTTEIRNDKAAPCTEAGYTGDTVCTVCKETVTTGQAIPATGHTIELRNDKAATCTEDGYTGDTVCTVCKETLTTGQAIPATGHTIEVRNAKEATCTEAGYTGDEYCTVCKETVKTGEAIPAIGHTIEVRNAKEATCTETGYTGDEYCTVCKTTVKTGEVIPVAEHSTEIRNAKEATCTETGYTGDEICTVCGTTVKTGETISAKGHTTAIQNKTDATCTADGYTGDEICTVCGTTVKTGEAIPATGHSTELRNHTEATCTEAGYTGDEYCTTCGILVKAGTVISAVGHIYDAGVVTKEATEDEEGILTYTCTVCGDTRTEAIPKLTVEKQAPTVSVSAVQGANGRITLTGLIVDFENADHYYQVVSRGLVYCSETRLGSRTLTVNTPGRTRVNFSSNKADGSYIYNMKPASSGTYYIVRAYVTYRDDNGKTIYVYSDPIRVSYNSLQ